MRIRKEQIKAMMLVPSQGIRSYLRDRIQADGRRTEVDAKSGDLLIHEENRGTSRIAFDQAGRAKSFRGVDGRLYLFEYDEVNRKVSLVDSAGRKTQYEYNEDLQLSVVIDPTGYRQELTYFEQVPIRLSRPESTGIRVSYDDNGFPKAMVDGRRHACQFEFHQSGALLRMMERSGAEKRYGYDQDGRITQLVTPTGNIYRFGYDPDNRRRAIQYPDGKQDVYQYQGELLSRFYRRNGSQVSYTYNANSKLVAVQYPDDRLGFGYDEQNQLLQADNGFHSVKFEYDELGRRVVEKVDGRRIELRYNEEGLLSELITHRNERIIFDHGNDQRVNLIIDWDRKAYKLARDERGSVCKVILPNKITRFRSFTPLGSVKLDELWYGTETIRREYHYDANDLLAEVDDSRHGKKQHHFDADDRLIGVESSHQQVEYKFDGHGNIIRLGDAEYFYNELDQIIHGTGVRCQYDALGNLIAWTEDGATTRFIYNSQNQLVKAELPDGRIAEYEYDAFGRRIVKRYNNITTTYIWWGEQLLAEDIEGPEPVKIDYLYIPGTLQPLAMRVNGKSYYYQTDHLDTPIRLIDESGRIVWAGEPHGFDFLVWAGSVRQPLRFPGQYLDEETGLFYNGARYYHPRIGRYLSPDPMFWEDQTNLYVYANNNPVAFIDPSGRLVFLAIVAAVLIGAAIGAAFAGAKKIADNTAQGKPWDDGIGGAMLGGAGFGAVGGLAVGLGAPLLLVGLAGLALPAAKAAYDAPEGEGVEACLDNLPVVGSIRRYEKSAGDPHRDTQLGVDLAFDALGIGLLVVGARAGRGGGPPKGFNFELPVPRLQPTMATAGGPPIPGGFVVEPVAISVPVSPAAQAAGVAPAMAMASTGGTGGGDDTPKKPKTEGPWKQAPNPKKWVQNGGKVEPIKSGPNKGGLKYTNRDGVSVEYNAEGYPDFSPHAKYEANIGQQEGNYTTDYSKANKAIGQPELGSDPPPDCIWHHKQDGKTMQAVPEEIHSEFKHQGGVSKVRGQ